MGLREFPLPFSAEAVARVDAGLSGFGGGFVVLNPGGGWASKLWPAERFGELAKGLRTLGLRPLVSWGPGEEGLADRVVAASGGAAVRSFPTTLLDYVEIARRARLVVAADTGPAPPRLRGRDAGGGSLRPHRPRAQRALLPR